MKFLLVTVLFVVVATLDVANGQDLTKEEDFNAGRGREPVTDDGDHGAYGHGHENHGRDLSKEDFDDDPVLEPMLEPTMAYNHTANPRFLRSRELTTEKTEGTFYFLAIRVIATECSPPCTEPHPDIKQMQSDLFQRSNTFVSQYEKCSYGKLKLRPVFYRLNGKAVYGVVEVRLPLNAGLIAPLVAAAKEKLKIPDRVKLKLWFFPPEQKWNNPDTGVYGSFTSGYAWYEDVWIGRDLYNNTCGQMHEVGHSLLGLSHSSEPGSGYGLGDYGDWSGFMGHYFVGDDKCHVCFNGAHSWELGWYKDRCRNATRGYWYGTIAGVADYGHPQRHPVVLRIPHGSPDYYVAFNPKIGITATPREGGNKVLVTTKMPGDRQNTWLVAKLDEGKKYCSEIGLIKVSKIDVQSVPALATIAYERSDKTFPDIKCRNFGIVFPATYKPSAVVRTVGPVATASDNWCDVPKLEAVASSCSDAGGKAIYCNVLKYKSQHVYMHWIEVGTTLNVRVEATDSAGNTRSKWCTAKFTKQDKQTEPPVPTRPPKRRCKKLRQRGCKRRKCCSKKHVCFKNRCILGKKKGQRCKKSKQCLSKKCIRRKRRCA